MKLNWNIGAKAKQQYPIFIQSNCLQELIVEPKQFKAIDRVVVLYDKNVEHIARPIIEQQALPCEAIAVPGHEDSKNLKQYERIVEDMVRKSITKQSVLVIIGGGMMCDLGGFVAATYKRGMRSILVPTNFVAMIDAGIGGKTSLNIGKLKNCIGNVYHHAAIYIDPSLVANGKQEWIEAGLVEAAKNAAMCDAEFFGWLEEHCDELIGKNEKLLTTCIKHAIENKKTIVNDELLTCPVVSATYFGHGIGHSLEALTHFELRHTQAVSIGIHVEMGMCKCSCHDRVLALLQKLHQPLEVPIEVRTQELWDLLRTQYPATPGTVPIIAPKTLGQSHIYNCTFEDLVAARE